MSLLTLTHLKKYYRTPDGQRELIVDIPHWQTEAGSQIVLHGSSGCGKTTFLNLIAGILQPDEGSVQLAGRNITALTEAQRDAVRGGSIGYIFQTFNLLQGYTALENVELAMHMGCGLDRARAVGLLNEVGLSDRLSYRPGQLSIGQQQRVAVARALANGPMMVLADEPTGNLDQRRAQDAIVLIRQLCQENNATLILVSHDLEILQQFDSVIEFSEINRATAPATPTEAL